MMLVRDLFRLSLHNLLLHKVRSILTSLGVIFGVGSVIAMLAVSEGAKRSALAQIEAMGIDKIILFSKRPPLEGRSEGSENASVMERYGLTERDLLHISRMDNVERITGVFDARKKVLKGLQRTDLKLVGCDYRFLEDSSARIEKGRWFSPVDFKNESNVCVIGKNVKRKLFSIGRTDIVGDTIRIENGVYRIVGILSNEYGTQYPEVGGQNDMILIPMATARAKFKDYTYQREGRQFKITRIAYDLFLVKVNDTSYIDNTSKRIAAYLEKVHDETRDWGMVVPLELLKQREQTQNIFTIVMGSIAGISLVVGGIGIMNIMLVSVTERTREIGLKIAIGAQQSRILWQFLTEAAVLTSMGGILGVATGIGLAEMMSHIMGTPVAISVPACIIAVAFSMVIGVVFGLVPAMKASKLNPIEALRRE